MYDEKYLYSSCITFPTQIFISFHIFSHKVQEIVFLAIQNVLLKQFKFTRAIYCSPSSPQGTRVQHFWLANVVQHWVWTCTSWRIVSLPPWGLNWILTCCIVWPCFSFALDTPVADIFEPCSSLLASWIFFLIYFALPEPDLPLACFTFTLDGFCFTPSIVN